MVWDEKKKINVSSKEFQFFFPLRVNECGGVVISAHSRL